MNSVVADPVFMDLANNNFTLAPTSPALDLGFVQIDWQNIGRIDACDAPGQASSGLPANYAMDVSTDIDLTWKAAGTTESYDIYFGTANPPSFVSSKATTTYDPGTLSGNTKYYWRVNSINSCDTTIGNLYVFATTGYSEAPTISSNPQPLNDESDVEINASVPWTPGQWARTHDVYFGTTNPPAFIGNQSESTYGPGTLDANTTYYWRIDEVNGDSTTQGDVWSFTTSDNTKTVSEKYSTATKGRNLRTTLEIYSLAGRKLGVVTRYTTGATIHRLVPAQQAYLIRFPDGKVTRIVGKVTGDLTDR